MPPPRLARTPSRTGEAMPESPGSEVADAGSCRFRLGDRCASPSAPAENAFNRRASGEERRHDVRVELQARLDADGGRCRLEALDLAVGSVCGEVVEASGTIR